MKFWAVTHRHTAYVEAETEAEALENCADQVRENAEAGDCIAEEIDGRGYEQHWALIENGPHGANAPRVRGCLKCQKNIRQPGDRTERQINMAHHEACTCGGAGPGEGCPACDTWHYLYPANDPAEERRSLQPVVGSLDSEA